MSPKIPDFENAYLKIPGEQIERWNQNKLPVKPYYNMIKSHCGCSRTNYQLVRYVAPHDLYVIPKKPVYVRTYDEEFSALPGVSYIKRDAPVYGEDLVGEQVHYLDPRVRLPEINDWLSIFGWSIAFSWAPFIDSIAEQYDETTCPEVGYSGATGKKIFDILQKDYNFELTGYLFNGKLTGVGEFGCAWSAESIYDYGSFSVPRHLYFDSCSVVARDSYLCGGALPVRCVSA